jgi:arylsulfatase A-like enzyme
MTRRAKNILFVMCDQLRFDHLSCYGHPKLHTPHLDALAARGVAFDRAYVQSPLCGPSRMSYYTGRYMHAHGVSWNFVPLKAGEMTIGDHLRPLGVRCALVGKTHMRADQSGMARMGIDPKSTIGVRIAECGFDPYERDDGLHPFSGHDPDPHYNQYLRDHGFGGDNPWESWANTVTDEQGQLRSGWFLKYSHLPARVPAEHSETAYTTTRAMDFMRVARRSAPGQPWLLHLSYIKPHWPYVVPKPYAGMYRPQDALPVVRSDDELRDPHPVYGAMTRHRVSRTFADSAVRDAVMVGYMGLVKQVDDELGRLFAFMSQEDLMDETMIVFCADHGDYLGDHWLGDKEMFHEAAVRTPLIVVDPDTRADATRGTRCDALVEAIDLAPTFLDVHEGQPLPHVMDGRSLRPLLFGEQPAHWRRIAVSECDYAFQSSRIELQTPAREAWMRMAFDGRWKYVLTEGYRPMLFDLDTDPQELRDLGASLAAEHVAARERLHEELFRWARQPRQRVTIPDDLIEATDIQSRVAEGGILIGYADEADLAAQRQRFTPRFASTNPLVKQTLDMLTGRIDA